VSSPSTIDLWAMLAGAERGYLALSSPAYEGAPNFIPVTSPRRFCRAVESLAYTGDLEVCAVPMVEARWREPDYSNVLWLECDTPKARAALEAFQPAPTLVLAAGARRVALWALSRGLDRHWTERLNKRIAHHVGAPKKHCSPYWMFSPPGTVLREGKARPVVVETLSWTGALYGAKQVAGHLEEAPDPRAAWAAKQAREAVS
jgi:hypothetical protein